VFIFRRRDRRQRPAVRQLLYPHPDRDSRLLRAPRPHQRLGRTDPGHPACPGRRFLGWIIEKSLQGAPPSQIWSLVGVAVLGVVLMFAARFILRSPFFHIQRESDGQRVAGQHTGSHRR
jgi:hypothetical protein